MLDSLVMIHSNLFSLDMPSFFPTHINLGSQSRIALRSVRPQKWDSG